MLRALASPEVSGQRRHTQSEKRQRARLGNGREGEGHAGRTKCVVAIETAATALTEIQRRYADTVDAVVVRYLDRIRVHEDSGRHGGIADQTDCKRARFRYVVVTDVQIKRPATRSQTHAAI